MAENSLTPKRSCIKSTEKEREEAKGLLPLAPHTAHTAHTAHTTHSAHENALAILLPAGYLCCAEFLASPHCDERPAATPIDMIVIHGISLPAGHFNTGYVEALFLGSLDAAQHADFRSIAGMRVSAHLFIKREGAIVQFVPFAKRAWHAGESYFQGKSHCNDFSIGIELEGSDDIPYTAVQYSQLIAVIKALNISFPLITADRIIGHCDIAPGRKEDPGPHFNWEWLREQLQHKPR